MGAENMKTVFAFAAAQNFKSATQTHAHTHLLQFANFKFGVLSWKGARRATNEDRQGGRGHT